jgi:hypothetical protein
MKRLLSHGYFPAELPPPFHTRDFADHVTSTALPQPYVVSATKEPKFVSRAVPYNLARAGTLRRGLAIPNPVNFYLLASTMTGLWPKLKVFYDKADQSLSKPKPAPGGADGRAYEWKHSLGLLQERRASIRSGKRYALQTDIKGFYPSVYTHSIPWALHGKQKSQQKTGWADLFGNKIDRLHQIAQSKQTKGIPIGPDTSFLAAEILLARIDQRLLAEGCDNYFRFLDDYEFAFRTFNEAERGLAKFQEVLSGFELIANEVKTRIVELPAPLDGRWSRTIRVLPLASAEKAASQRTNLFDLFNVVMELWREFPDQAVVRYAISKVASTFIAPENWKLYQELLFQWAQAEPAVLAIVLDVLATYRAAGFGVDYDQLAEVLHLTVQLHAPRGHTSEVAWALWGHILFSLPLESSASLTVRRMDNAVIALLALDARSKGLIDAGAKTDYWDRHMTPEGLRGEHWLLAYEARLKKWLPPVGAKDYIKTAPGFDTLAAASIPFYDANKSATYVPTSTALLQAKLDAIVGEADVGYF